MDLKKVVLNDLHVELGGKMVSFAGFNMPVRYSSDIEEHKCVREDVGVFDVSHMGEFRVHGPGALALIQKIISNDASKLFDGKIQYACFPNETGGIVDDLLVYKIADGDYMLVVNAGNIDKDWAWVNKFNAFGVKLENRSDQISLFAVQGPKAKFVIQKLTEVNVMDMEYYSFIKATFAGIKDVIISATGYTGAGGFEIYLPNKDARTAWVAIFAAGAEYNIKPIGLGARDTLRLEKGYCLYGNDIDDSTSPIEAGLGWVTKFTKEFTNSEALLKQKEEGVSRKLVGFKMIDRGIPRSHYEIVDANLTKIGEVTSGTQSPMLGYGIGMGYVKPEFSSPGAEIFILIREKLIKAEVVMFPFL